MLCLHLQIVYFPGQYQLREWRVRRAWIGMEVKIAIRWGWEGIERRAPISACCASEFTCFFFPFYFLVHSLPFTSSCFISRPVKVDKKAAWLQGFQSSNMWTHSTNRVSWHSFTSYPPRRWSVQLQWSSDRKSIFARFNDLVSSFSLLHMCTIPSLFFSLRQAVHHEQCNPSLQIFQRLKWVHVLKPVREIWI